MATFFGEVVPVFSRAVDEDDEQEEEQDDDEEEDREIRRELERKREVVLRWSSDTAAAIETSPEHSLPCSRFILAVGGKRCRVSRTALDSGPGAALHLEIHLTPAQGFVSSHILSSGSWEVAGHITLWNERCQEEPPGNDSAASPSSCTFYRSVAEPAVMLCQCQCYVAEDQQFQWCEKVLSCLQKSSLKVTILSTCPVSDYKTQESTYNLPVPFLKALRTKHYTDAIPCSPLEQPNVMDGLPAAVMAYCQVWGIPSVCYQCYTDITKLDSITIGAFRTLLSCQSMSRLAAKCENIAETLKKTVRPSAVQSNMYI
ncbi:proteasome assembly chaperone 1 [Gastrophryne carolinensis]